MIGVHGRLCAAWVRPWVAVFVAALSIAPGARAADVVTTPFPGVGITQIHRSVTSPRLNNIYIVIFDLNDPRIEFFVTPRDPTFRSSASLARTTTFVNQWGLDGAINANFWAGGLGLPHQRREEKASRERALRALAMVGLEGSADLPAASLPYGSQRLVEIARALVSEPRLLLLDEPLEAVDPVSARIIREVLQAYVAGGRTVVLSSHVMALVEDLCSHVAVMNDGVIVTSGPVAQVRGDAATLDDAFFHIVGGRDIGQGGLEWLRSSQG